MIPSLRMRARIGVVKTALLVGEFEEAEREAASLVARHSAAILTRMAVHADALWSAGLFDEAEREFRDALAHRAGDVARSAWPGQGDGVAVAAR